MKKARRSFYIIILLLLLYFVIMQLVCMTWVVATWERVPQRVGEMSVNFIVLDIAHCANKRCCIVDNCRGTVCRS